AHLAAHVVVRDRTCRFPTCHRPAILAEIDHRIPYERGGTTDPDNTWALHTGHHRAKTWHRFATATDLHGTTWWITPAGHRYPVEPEAIGPIRTRIPEPVPF
ncbi:HNH endonuclease signature motif containing protein, partial [Jiangella anatolica]